MKVFVVGSTGRVAEKLLEILSQAGHEVLAGARRPEAVVKLNHVTPVLFDLHDSVDQLAEQLGQAQAIIFVAGSRGKDLLQTDAFGAVKVIQAAEKRGIKRFIMLSSLFALEPERWEHPGFASLKDYNVAKFFADNYLITDTNLDYTIVQPGALKEEAATGKIQVISDQFGNISIPDLAQVLAELLVYPNTIGKVIKLISGDQAISEALSEV